MGYRGVLQKYAKAPEGFVPPSHDLLLGANSEDQSVRRVLSIDEKLIECASDRQLLEFLKQKGSKASLAEFHSDLMGKTYLFLDSDGSIFLTYNHFKDEIRFCSSGSFRYAMNTELKGGTSMMDEKSPYRGIGLPLDVYHSFLNTGGQIAYGQVVPFTCAEILGQNNPEASKHIPVKKGDSLSAHYNTEYFRELTPEVIETTLAASLEKIAERAMLH